MYQLVTQSLPKARDKIINFTLLFTCTKSRLQVVLELSIYKLILASMKTGYTASYLQLPITRYASLGYTRHAGVFI